MAAAEAEAEKQRRLIAESQLRHYARLNELAYRFFVKNADLCGEATEPVTGMRLANEYSLGRDFETTLAEGFGLGDTATVVAVAADSPAARAGIAKGDTIVSVNGWEVPSGPKALERLGEKFAELAKKGQALEIAFRRAGDEYTAAIAPERGCAYRVAVVPDDTVNAMATGEAMIFFTGMMRFTETEEELATVFGHEMAHNLMDHVEKRQGNAALGFLVDLLFAGMGVNTQGAFSRMAASAYGKEFEAEADYVGVYLAARAGYEVKDSPTFWRRMAVAHPKSVELGYGSTHPATPERFVALEKTAAEVAAKRQSGQALLPEAEIPEHRPPEPADSRIPWR